MVIYGALKGFHFRKEDQYTFAIILGRSEEGCLNMHDRFPFQVVELSDTIVKCPQLHWNGNLTLKYSRREVKVPG